MLLPSALLFGLLLTPASAATTSSFLPKSVWAKVRCAPDNGNVATPTYGDGAVFTACVERVIKAPVEKGAGSQSYDRSLADH
jgi:hypothetical protein